MRLVAVVPVALRASLLAASIAIAAGAQASPAPVQAVTRRDLADAYLLMDGIVTSRGIPEAQRATWNQDFDRTTLAFFGGDFTKVLREMHDLTARILGDSAPGSPTRQLLALRLRTIPRVVSPLDRVVRIEATVMYAGEQEPSRTLQVHIQDAGGARVFEGSMRINPFVRAGDTQTLVVPAGELAAMNARYVVVATIPGAAAELRVPVFTLAAPLSDLHAELQGALAAIPSGVDPQAVASLQARIGLLRDVPDENSTAQMLADPVALAAALIEESTTLRAGRDPYRRTGDIWRVLQMPGGPVPFRLYVPPQARTSDALPLVLALHGAGGDENMFFVGYGAGRLRQLADSAGFIAVTPATVEFARDPATLDSLLAVVARANPYDRRRVYILGHSLGAGIGLQLASRRADVLRAGAFLAGMGNVPPDRSLIPTLFIAAERDLVIPAARVRATYEQLRGRNAPVEFYLAQGWGHTHVVSAELDRAIRFLLAH